MNVHIDGISEYFYFAIPAILGLAALYWLWFGEGLHVFRRTLSQERRRAEAVGAKWLPKEPIVILMDDPKDAAVRVCAVDVEGEYAWVSYENVGSVRAKWLQYSWKQIAPDGTVINSCWGNASPDTLEAGQKAEMKIRIYNDDPRTKTFAIRLSH